MSAANPSRSIRLIVVHCAATPNDRTLFSGTPGTARFRTPVDEIDLWHKQARFQRDSYWRGRQNGPLGHIGYHYVIARNGALFSGRHHDEVGAHASGWNRGSLGVCLLGTDQFTDHQWAMLASNITSLATYYGIPLQPPELHTQGKVGVVAKPGICGHRDLPGHRKTCPGFDVATWLAGGLAPLAGHIHPAPEAAP